MKELSMDVPDELMHQLDGFLGLIVHRGDVDEEQALELLDRVKQITR